MRNSHSMLMNLVLMILSLSSVRVAYFTASSRLLKRLNSFLGALLKTRGCQFRSSVSKHAKRAYLSLLRSSVTLDSGGEACENSREIFLADDVSFLVYFLYSWVVG